MILLMYLFVKSKKRLKQNIFMHSINQPVYPGAYIGEGFGGSNPLKYMVGTAHV